MAHSSPAPGLVRRLLSAVSARFCLLLVLLGPLPVAALEFAWVLPLSPSGAGTLSIRADVGGVPADFLVDTGAGMVTIDRELYRALSAAGSLREVRRVGLRSASGRVHPVTVYEVAHFRLGSDCDLGPLEVAVMERGGRNLLGLSALQRAAPFALDPAAARLHLSACAGAKRVAARL